MQLTCTFACKFCIQILTIVFKILHVNLICKFFSCTRTFVNLDLTCKLFTENINFKSVKCCVL